jgi:hypothetical protein
MQDLLAFTGSGEWKISGAGENGAISPKAVVAHQQTRIGSRIQPISVNNSIILVQTSGTKVHTLGYNLDSDGYSGNELSVLSEHLLEHRLNREVYAMTYQQIPDSILWFSQMNGEMISCTYMPEHSLAGWARHTSNGVSRDLTCIPAASGSELWAVKDTRIDRMTARMEEANFSDVGVAFESSLQTLRLNLDAQGSMFSSKKLIPRLALQSLRSYRVRIAPATNTTRSKWRALGWTYSEEMTESEIMLDSGFEGGAAIRLWTIDATPCTILGISPMYTIGG